MHKLLAGMLVATLVAACGPTLSRSIKVPAVALGKVVVYRNGVAFYERRAQVRGGKLTVSVPRERVDDFLKSLTVVDARTQTPLPVAFPRTQSAAGAYIEMTLDVPVGNGGVADVLLTYVTESSAWKPSYRLVVGEHGKVMLEGWAIVDNLSGEDWHQVKVGVGSSSAMSFRYDLWSVRTVERAALTADAQFAIAPPTAVSPYGGSVADAEQTVVMLDDGEIRRPAGHPEAPGGGAFSGSSSVESTYVVDGVNTTGAETITVQDTPPTIDPTSSRQGVTIDQDYAQRIPVAGRSFETALGSAPGVQADGGDAPAPPPPPPPRNRVLDGDQKLQAIVPDLVKRRAYVVVEGYAAPGEPDAAARALDRANVVKNQLIDAGLPPARIRAVSKGAVAGRGAGVQLLTEAPPAAGPAGDDGRDGAGRAGDVADDATPVGESHFLSGVAMDVAQGTSAMVSVLRTETQGEEVYLYDAESQRGNARFAFKAVRLLNPTDFTLEAGPVTVYGRDRYIGEGLTEPVPPRAPVVVPFALDRQVVIDRDESTGDEVSRLVTLQRGVLTAEVQHLRRTRLTFTSRLTVPTRVYVRHTIEKGWTLRDPELPTERVGDAHLFEVALAPGETRQIELVLTTPLTRTLDLNAPATLDLMKVFVERPHADPILAAQLRALLGIHRELADGEARIAGLRDHLVEYRARSAELTDQLDALKKVKSATGLSRHLADRLREVSDRVQVATIEIVDGQEALMLARVRFQDALAELTLPELAVAAAR